MQTLWNLLLLFLSVGITSCYFRHYSVPAYPKIEQIENFTGVTLHNHYYWHPGDFKGASVVTLWSGPSGKDITCELSTYCSKIFYSHRQTKSQLQLPGNILELPTIKNVR